MVSYYAALAIALGLTYILIAGRERTLSLPLMFVAGTMFFLLPGMVTGRNLLRQVEPSSEYYAIAAIVVSIVGFIACYRAFAPKVAKRPRRPIELSIPLSTLSVLVALSAVAKVFLDPDTIVGRLYTGVHQADSSAARYVALAASLPTALGCLTPWLWRETGAHQRGHRFLILLLAAISLISLSRTPIFYVAGCACLQLLWFRRSYWDNPRKRLAVVSACVLLAPAATFLAALVKGSNLVVDSAIAGKGLDLQAAWVFASQWRTEGSISDSYGNLLFIVDNYPTVYAYDPSLSILTLLTAPVPRSLFPWKPWPAAYHVTNEILGAGTYERTGTSLAPSTVGEFWMNGGLAAVILGSLALGLLAALIDRWAALSDESYKTAVLHMAMVMFFLIPRGDLLSTLVRGMIYIIFAGWTGRTLTRRYGLRRRRIEHRAAGGVQVRLRRDLVDT